MDAKVKKLWVEELRSGKWKQGRGVLCSVSSTGEENHCCLGVLCEIAIQEGVCSKDVDDDNGRFGQPGEELAIAYLPSSVISWAGLRTPSGAEVVIENEALRLNAHNDRGKTFAQIADAIEEQL